MELVSIIISAFVTIFAAGLLLISFGSYRKYSNLKLLFISGVFSLFFVKGILYSLSLFYPIFFEFFSSSWSGVFDLIILVLLFIATLKR